MKQILFAVVIAITALQCKKTTIITTTFPELPNGSENSKSVGASANDLLSANKYSRMIVEISYMPGMQLQAQSINNLTTFLNTYLNKPGGVQIVQQQVTASGKATMNLQDIAATEALVRTNYTAGDKIAVHILVTDAAYENQNVLGVAYRNTSLVLNGKTIHQNSGGLGQTSRVKAETTVLNHEFGHILGLVDIGSPMQTNHKDAAHGAHCNNSNCLMYYRAENADFLGILLTGNIPTLDANCVNDLKANGGK